jgi:tetratricopeptide (TPR) repeat protein
MLPAQNAARSQSDSTETRCRLRHREVGSKATRSWTFGGVTSKPVKSDGVISYTSTLAALVSGGNRRSTTRTFTTLVLLSLLGGCAELRARHEARKGNDLFRDGDYAAAVARYEESQRIFPEFPTSALNHGLACRQMMSVGSDSPESQKAADCALKAFKHLEQIAPKDERGPQLYEQTLFDANRFEELEKMYLAQFEKDPKSMLAVNALIQVYGRWDKWDEGFKWEVKRAELAPNDPDAHYSLGVLLFNRLMEKGGTGLATRFDPRPGAENKFLAEDEAFKDLKPGEVPPFFSVGQIVGARRIEMADLGLKHLARALELRSDYTEAMVFTNLLLRQKALAYLGDAVTWEALMKQADDWGQRAAALTASHVAASQEPAEDQPPAEK